MEPWLGAGAVLLSGICGAAFTYGVMSGKVGSLQMQIRTNTDDIRERVTRDEFDRSYHDILRSLERIEQKVDRWVGSE